MLRTSITRLLTATLLWSLVGHARSRHIHHRPVHAHKHHRNVDTLSFNITPPLPSATAGDTAANDVEDIEHDLSSLSEDIQSFIAAVAERFQQLEGLLAGLLSGSNSETTASSIVAQTASSTPATMQISPTLGAATATTITVASATYSQQGAEPAMTGSSDSITTTVTSTSTSYITRTEYMPAPSVYYANSSSINGTYKANPTVPRPGPYHSTYETAVAPTITSSTSTQLPQSTSVYTFQPQATDNVAVYYGSGPIAANGDLLALCENPYVDIVILAFVTEFFVPEGYPTVQFGSGCSGPNAAQTEQAPGLEDCSELATEIAGCQEIGKPVLVSLGGYLSNTSFVSDDQAEQFAETLWNLFGAGTENEDLRPFGPNITIDGFDIDNEDHNTSYYDTFATALRSQFALDPNNNTYYVSAAPQCPRPDQSIPLGALRQADFVWVQFYNNPPCNLNATGFADSFVAWSQDLTTNTSSTQSPPRLYIGAAAFPGAGSGYVPGADLEIYTSGATDLYVDNLGGMMLWDGPEALANMDEYGASYLEYAKRALQ